MKLPSDIAGRAVLTLRAAIQPRAIPAVQVSVSDFLHAARKRALADDPATRALEVVR